jgi:hypothetical protein
MFGVLDDWTNLDNIQVGNGDGRHVLIIVWQGCEVSYTRIR